MAKKKMKVAFENFKLTCSSREQVFEGQSISGEATGGYLERWSLQGPDGLVGELEYANWDNGEKDVRCSKIDLLEMQGSKEERALKRLERGSLRLGIYSDDGSSWIELRQARFKPNSTNFWSNLFAASSEDLDKGAEAPVDSILLGAGAVAVGSKSQILGVSNATRNRICATFSKSNKSVPLIAFVLTRILPLKQLYPA